MINLLIKLYNIIAKNSKKDWRQDWSSTVLAIIQIREVLQNKGVSNLI